MARMARIVQENAIYHVTIRGNDKKDVFLCENDFLRYLKILKIYKNKFKFKLYAYTLMKNHIHLLLQPVENSSISKIMQAINQRYSRWFNKKHNRSGHLWQERFHSKIIEDEEYLVYCVDYIELNPLKDEIVKEASDYKWSSYRTRKEEIKNELVDEFELVTVTI